MAAPHQYGGRTADCDARRSADATQYRVPQTQFDDGLSKYRPGLKPVTYLSMTYIFRK